MPRRNRRIDTSSNFTMPIGWKNDVAADGGGGEGLPPGRAHAGRHCGIRSVRIPELFEVNASQTGI